MKTLDARGGGDVPTHMSNFELVAFHVLLQRR